jgi:hypothetical protein
MEQPPRGHELRTISPAERRHELLNGHVIADERTLRHLGRVTFRSLPEYEPPLRSEPRDELPEIPSSADFRDLCKLDAFQLALDLQWARVHRVEMPEVRIQPADLQATRWLLSAAVEVLDRRRPLVQLRSHLNARVFAAMETRLRDPPDTRQVLRPRSVHACQPVKRVIEACCVVDQGRTARALAARLEARRQGWLCTVLRLL